MNASGVVDIKPCSYLCSSKLAIFPASRKRLADLHNCIDERYTKRSASTTALDEIIERMSEKNEVEDPLNGEAACLDTMVSTRLG